MSRRFYWKLWVLICAGLLLSAGELHAQAAAQAPAARLYRGLLSERFSNVGIQGAFYNSGAGSGGYMTYPRNLGGGGTYGTVRITDTASSNWEAYRFSVRSGHGVWTMTSDASVVYSGIRIDMQDNNIVPMQYDVSQDPHFASLGKEYFLQRRPTSKMGYGASSLTGVEETSLGGNWWPGSPLIEEGRDSQPYSKEPVHIMNFNLGDYSPDDRWPEEIIVTKWTNSQGITITERAFAWSHPDFDDFYLDEYIIENTGDTNGDGERDLPAVAQSNFFVALQDKFNNSAAGQQTYHRYWRDERDWTQDDYYEYDQDLKILYNYDGDHPLYHDWDDSGDPYKDAFAHGTVTNGGKIGQGENTLMSFAHLGVAVVAYTNDTSSPYAFNLLDRNQGYVEPEGEQPYAVRYWEAHNAATQDDPHTGVMSETEIYSEVLGAGRQIDPNPTRPSGQISMLIFGPYNLPADGKIKLVVAYVGGHPGQVLGNTDPITWARKGNQDELAKGLDALKQNTEAARFAYANAYDIPDAPPDLNFRTGSSAFAQMTVDWPVEVEQATHPDYGTSDIAGYRVYRSTWFDVGPWELIADIPAGTTEMETSAYRVTQENSQYVFEDLQSAAGFFYHYSVRAYAKPQTSWNANNPNSPLGMADLPDHVATHIQTGQEGGWSAPTQRTYADESPFAVPSAQTEALEAQVRVVPNPYVSDDQHSYPGSTKIRFVGVPSKCRILVFSVSGELVSDFMHDDPQKGEHDYDQNTWVYNGEIASGVYFYVVKNMIEGANFGKLQKGTFMVIR